MERGMFFTYQSKQREGFSQFYQDCTLNVDVGRVLEGTEVKSIQVFLDTLYLDVDGERIRFKVEFVEQEEPVSVGVEA